MDMISIRRKLMAKMQSGGGRLPDAYQEVKYLESTGTQYIDTGYSPTTSFGFDVKASTLFVNASTVIGARTGTGNNNRLFPLGCYTSVKLRFIYGGSGNGYTYDYSYDLDDVLRLELKNTDDYFYINNQQRFQITRSSYVKGNDNTILLFGTSGYGSNKYLSTSRIYYAKFYEGETLVRNLVPCYRKSDDKPGMYDLISGVFRTNVGTGEFTVGPDVN